MELLGIWDEGKTRNFEDLLKAGAGEDLISAEQALKIEKFCK